MYKIAILGCENSHAENFLQIIRDEKYADVEVIGVYSSFPGEAEKLEEKYGVPVLESYDALVGQIDGLIVTARHGDNHYKYAKPYLESGIPMFIDKPITITEEEAREFLQEVKNRGIPLCGGSILKHASGVRELKDLVKAGENGAVLGGCVRAPIDLASEHGGFYFYAQHLVQMMGEVFGYYPDTVRVYRHGGVLTCTVRYADYDVTCVYTDKAYVYYMTVNFPQSVEGGVFGLEGASSREFRDFYDLLAGKPQTQSYEDIFAPVFIMNAMERALESGEEETVHRS